LQPPHGLALGHAWLWAMASEIPTARLLGDGSGLPDALLLLVTLRNVRRAAELAAKSLTRPRAQKILADALEHFDAAVPGVKAARDVIEHMDQYAMGEGREQQRLQASTPSLTKAELANQYKLRLEGTYDEPIVCIGPYSIEGVKVPGTAGLLFEGIRDAVCAEEEDPPQ
jgi:hypothetical protein